MFYFVRAIVRGFRGKARRRKCKAIEAEACALCDEYAADPAPDIDAYDLRLRALEVRFAKLYRRTEPDAARRILSTVMSMHGQNGERLVRDSQLRRAAESN